MDIKFKEENGLITKELYENGILVAKEEYPVPTEMENKPSLETQIQDIKNTIDLLLLKQEGLI